MKLTDKQAAFCALYAALYRESAQSGVIPHCVKAYIETFGKASKTITAFSRVYPLLKHGKIAARLAELGVTAEAISAERAKLARLIWTWGRRYLTPEIEAEAIAELRRVGWPPRKGPSF